MNRLERLTWLKEWYNDHRTELQTQPAMVEAIRANRQVGDTIRDLWFALFNKSLGGCSQCQADALIYLLMPKTEERMKQIMECKFRLKPGVLLTDTTGKLPDATIANLTDEIAVAYLQDNPARADLFEKIPENWSEMGAERPETSQADNCTTEGEKTQESVRKPAKKTTKR